MTEIDLNEFFDKILLLREDIKKLVKDYDLVSIEKIKNRFLYLAYKKEKEATVEPDKEQLVKLIQEAIETVRRHIDYTSAEKEIEKFKEDHQNRLRQLVNFPKLTYSYPEFQPPDKKLEMKEIWTEIEDKKVKLREEIENDVYTELDKIIIYIEANQQKLVWGYMLNHPESDLWQLVGDLGYEVFERIFMAKIWAGGQTFTFPNEKDFLNEGRQYIAKHLKEKYPHLTLENIASLINRQYEGDFIDERRIKYWLYQKETHNIQELPLSPEKNSKYNLKIDFKDNSEIHTKIFNAIQRRLFDGRFHEFLNERRKEDRRFAREKGKRKTVGKG